MKYKLNDYNDINDPFVEKLEELLPKNAGETMSYPQYCVVRDFFIHSLESARMTERARICKIVYDKRMLLDDDVKSKEAAVVLTEILTAI
jgi:hypothetical protein